MLTVLNTNNLFFLILPVTVSDIFNYSILDPLMFHIIVMLSLQTRLIKKRYICNLIIIILLKLLSTLSHLHDLHMEYVYC